MTFQIIASSYDHFIILFQSVFFKQSNEVMEVVCEFCKKSFFKETILKHIGKKVDCKSYYGDRFKELKKIQQRNKKRNQRKSFSRKKKKGELEKKRKYDQQPEQKEKKKHDYREKREKTREARELHEKEQIQEATNKAKERKSDEIESRKKWQCECCKALWEPESLLKHIGNTEKCKSFYGPKFDDLKRSHRRQRKQFYRKENGIKKELERQREAYASNPQKREEKRKRNEEAKKNQEIFRQEQKKEWRKKDAKETVLYFENSIRLNNKMQFESFKWISDCFKHFFETFKDIDDKTKNNLINFEKSFAKKYSSNESEIDEMTKNAKEGAEHYNGDCYPNHFNCNLFFKKENQYVQEFYAEEWNTMKKTTLDRLDEIFEQVAEPFKGTDWHISLGKINRIYANREYGRTMDKHFLEEKFCVICKDRAHRISFDPELAAKSKTYTYYGTSEVEKRY